MLFQELVRGNQEKHWLVVSIHLKNMSQLGWFFPIYGKIKFLFQTTNQNMFLQIVPLVPWRLQGCTTLLTFGIEDRLSVGFNKLCPQSGLEYSINLKPLQYSMKIFQYLSNIRIIAGYTMLYPWKSLNRSAISRQSPMNIPLLLIIFIKCYRSNMP